MAIIGVTVDAAAARPQAAVQATEKGEPTAWEELARSVKAGRYREDYEVGELIPISLGRFGDIHARIVAMDADPIDGSDRKAALSFLLSMPLPDRQKMNPGWAKEDPEDGSLFLPGTGAVDGWMACGLRKYLQEEVLPEFPQAVRDNIVPVAKASRTFTAKSQIFDVVTADRLWIPSQREVFGPGRFTELSGPVYDEAFEDDDDRIMRDGGGSASAWWLRSANGSTFFGSVFTDGSISYDYASGERGVVVGFCLGSGI